MLKRIISISVLVLIVSALIYYFNYNRDNEIVSLEGYEVINTDVLGREVILYVADSIEKQTQGLSGVEKLGLNEGMIFTYQNEGERVFWMKDMNFPIDILWFDEGNNLVHVEENVRPENYPDIYGRGVEALYIIEFNAGFIDKLSTD